jgi:hypothetical protein
MRLVHYTVGPFHLPPDVRVWVSDTPRRFAQPCLKDEPFKGAQPVAVVTGYEEKGTEREAPGGGWGHP